MRLIDADELIVMEYGGIKFVPKEFIDDAPKVDATEVIMCCECKNAHYDTLYGEYWCNGKKVKPNHYCGDAKRRQDG